MKLLNIMALAIAGSMAVFGLVLSKTNPTQSQYEEYAVNRLTEYLKTDVCKKTPKLIENLLHSNCDKLVDSNNSEIRYLLSKKTERQDLLLFSLYRTDLTLGTWLPGYKFETVGVLNNFYTYSSQQQ